jgi:hypothetical protein
MEVMEVTKQEQRTANLRARSRAHITFITCITCIAVEKKRTAAWR